MKTSNQDIIKNLTKCLNQDLPFNRLPRLNTTNKPKPHSLTPYTNTNINQKRPQKPKNKA